MVTPKNVSKQLSRLLGSWHTTGKMLSGPDAGKPFSGSDIYRWLPGSMFLQHTWNIRMPDGVHRGLEIFGIKPDQQGIFAHAYDADGSFASSQVTFRGHKFSMHGDDLSFVGAFSKDGNSITGVWSTTAESIPVMDVNLVRKEHKA